MDPPRAGSLERCPELQKLALASGQQRLYGMECFLWHAHHLPCMSIQVSRSAVSRAKGVCAHIRANTCALDIKPASERRAADRHIEQRKSSRMVSARTTLWSRLWIAAHPPLGARCQRAHLGCAGAAAQCPSPLLRAKDRPLSTSIRGSKGHAMRW